MSPPRSLTLLYLMEKKNTRLKKNNKTETSLAGPRCLPPPGGQPTTQNEHRVHMDPANRGPRRARELAASLG